MPAIVGTTAAPAIPVVIWDAAVAGKLGMNRIAIEAALMVRAEPIMMARLAWVASTNAPSGAVATIPA